MRGERLGSRMTGQDRGFSVIELLVVVGIASVLVALAGIQYSRWMARYNVEREIREMHTDLMNAKARAMTRNRLYFVVLAAGRYTIYEDTRDASGTVVPDGDGILQTANDTVYLQKTLSARYPIRWSDVGVTQLTFNTKGMYDSATAKVICTDANIAADYNCIEVLPTRIGLGKLTTTGGACSEANCVVK